MTNHRGPGRPALPAAEVRKPRSVRLSDAELAEIASAAEADGTANVSRWIADAALEKARRTRP
ncbi:hypothetical protein [Curtobacterium sp. PhB115]|uniref:hypothetical protein n=1 Tax=Curtobacterium sp. PhB115 TaxID=2485173 RepID=UPI0011CE3EB9|nr:hypothetical protein [Curtobacterium sp. PhB115]